MTIQKARAERGAYPLTPLQQGMLFNQLSSPDDTAMEMEQILISDLGLLDVDCFRRAWRFVVQRHEILRSRFEWADGMPRQIVEPEITLEIDVVDWRNIARDSQTERLQHETENDKQIALDLARAPMYRVKVIDIGDDGYHCLWTFHHSALDGGSFTIVIADLYNAYDALLAGRRIQLEPVRPFREYVEWLSASNNEEAKHYWGEVLAGFSRPTPIGVPWQLETPAGTSRRGFLEHRLSNDLVDRLRAAAQRSNVTLFTLVQGAWSLLLHRLTGETDIVFGTTRSGRTAALPGIRDMVGLLIATPPMRVIVDPDMAVKEWLAYIRQQHIAHRQHEHISAFDLLRGTDLPAGAPLFESHLVFNNSDLNSSLARLNANRSVRSARSAGNPNAQLYLNGFVDDDGLLFWLRYFRDRYDDETATRMLGNFQTILESLAAGAAERVGDVAVLTEKERAQILVDWNDTAVEFPAQRCLHHLFEARVEEQPDALAVVCGADRLSYAELDSRANSLARYLRRRGVTPGMFVGLCVRRSAAMMVALLGILKAGAAYVPMDPSYPRERLRYMLEAARCAVLVGEDGLTEGLGDDALTRVRLDVDRDAIAREPDLPIDVPIDPEGVAYVIFTSGSTGKPKGVQVPHRAVVNFVNSMSKKPGLTPEDRLLAVTTLSFDIHVLELFGPLVNGGSVVLATNEQCADGSQLQRLIVQTGVTVMQATPTTWRLLIAAGWQGGAGFRALVGGEVLPREVLRDLLARLPGVWNMYGPTETTVWSTCGWLTDADTPILIGHPIDNTQVYVLDEALQPVPVGAPGELYIGGAGVTHGYLLQPSLTAERFVNNPFARSSGRLYRTGDIVRFHRDGNLEFLHRLDGQIKVRGLRIELGEIESVLREHPDVDSAVVKVWEREVDDVRLVAYCVPKPGRVILNEDLHVRLRRRLPDYMVPPHVVHLEKIPLTHNGKIDRNALRDPGIAALEHEAELAQPLSESERMVAEIWENMLGVQRVGAKSNFFELGGHSLLALRVVAEIERITGMRLPVSTFFERPTIREIVNSFGEDANKNHSLVLLNSSERRPNGANPPLFCISGIYLYQPLAAALEDVMSIYGIFVNDEIEMIENPPSSVETNEFTGELARQYINAIRNCQERGPYRIAGLSYGGVIAFEIAQQLHAMGEEVEAVIMFDSAVPGDQSTTLFKRLSANFAEACRQGPKFLVDRVMRRFTLRRRQLDYSLRKSINRYLQRVRYAPRLNDPSIRSVDAVQRLERLDKLKNYRPEVYPGRLIIFRATDSSPIRGFVVTPQLGWEGHAAKGINVFDVTGEHVSMLDDDNVAQIAGVLRTVFRSDEDRDMTTRSKVEYGSTSKNRRCATISA